VYGNSFEMSGSQVFCHSQEAGLEPSWVIRVARDGKNEQNCSNGHAWMYPGPRQDAKSEILDNITPQEAKREIAGHEIEGDSDAHSPRSQTDWWFSKEGGRMMRKLPHITLERITIIFLIAIGLAFGWRVYNSCLGAKAVRRYHVLVNEWRRQPLIDEYLKAHHVRRLQLGAGSINLPGWLNTDIDPRPGQVYLDASERFPLPDQSVRYVYAQQVLEHLPYELGLVMLKESYRVLEPGGIIRLGTPNLQRLIALYDERDGELKRRVMDDELFKVYGGPTTPCDMLNMYFSFHKWGHQFVYDPATLVGALERVGFRSVRLFETNESDDPYLVGIERRCFEVHGQPRAGLVEVAKYITMVAQASM